MIKARLLPRLLIFALVISSCSIEINQQPVATPTPLIEVNPTISATALFPTTHVPITWSQLNLTGRLIYISSTMEGDATIANIQMLDLVIGNITTIFNAQPGAWIYYATISPDAKRLVMSYAPPSQSNSPSSRSLYIMSLDQPNSPQSLFTPPTADDHYTQAEWSPDGEYIYYVHYNSNNRLKDLLDPVYDISRIRYPDGQPEKIADNALWLRISSDSSKLVYTSILPVSGSIDPASGKNELFQANSDGSDAQKVTLSGPVTLDIIDAPIFSPDGQSILFSAPEPTQAYRPNWFEKLAGIQVAKAHSIPSDWWSVPNTGGIPTRLTNIQTINLFASISPDKKYIASVSGDGLFVMDLDGSGLTQLISDTGVHGTVSWMP
jgi:Tol biopolymer transport system component